MRKPVPVIHESADDLKQRLGHERHPARRQRLHALYLLATEQARHRTEVADLLSVDRNTVGRWLRPYEQGGLSKLLDVYIPAGKQPALSAQQVAQLQHALQQPDGFASYDDIRRWIAQTLGVQLTDNAVHKLVRYTLKAKPKVARPTHAKKTLSR